MKTVFNIGDQVLTIRKMDGMNSGQCGWVKQPLGNSEYPTFIQLGFDTPVDVGGISTSTWWFHDNYLELIEQSPLLGDEDEDCV